MLMKSSYTLNPSSRSLPAPPAAALLILMAVFGVVTACSSSSDVTGERETKPLREHEEAFDPTAYRTIEKDTATVPEPEIIEPEEENVTWVERVRSVMGFRIQLHSTTQIDDAQERLVSLQSTLDSLDIAPARLDMSFDAPYYKIRLGDFLTKPPADSLRDLLHEQGMTEAWVVRDKVKHVFMERKR